MLLLIDLKAEIYFCFHISIMAVKWLRLLFPLNGKKEHNGCCEKPIRMKILEGNDRRRPKKK